LSLIWQLNKSDEDYRYGITNLTVLGYISVSPKHYIYETLM
jgi:hypothetical protein